MKLGVRCFVRVVFDVNVLIRFSFGSTLVASLIERVAAEGFVVLTHEILAAELAETATKPRLAGRIDRAACDDLLGFLRDVAEPVKIQQPFPACRDPDDGYLLALARDGGADVLVTNDLDLLSMKRVERCEIMTAESFSDRLGKRE